MTLKVIFCVFSRISFGGGRIKNQQSRVFKVVNLNSVTKE
jgi:hypothetical protein